MIYFEFQYVGKPKKRGKGNAASDEVQCLDDLSSKMNNMDLNEKMAEKCADEYVNMDLCRGTYQDKKFGEKPLFETQKDSDNFKLKDNLFYGAVTSRVNFSESKKFHADVDNANSKQRECSQDVVCISPDIPTSVAVNHIHEDQVLATNGCGNTSCVSVDSLCSLENISFSASVDSSPAENEKTILNLVDITPDQNFGGGLESIDDLFADSFVAGLQNTTPLHDVSKLFSNNANGDSRDSVVFESSTGNQRESVVSIQNRNWMDSLQGCDLVASELKHHDVSSPLDELNCPDKKFNEHNVKSFVTTADTPSSSQERNSLSCRLLKRFQMQNRSTIADKLRSISCDEVLVSCVSNSE